MSENQMNILFVENRSEPCSYYNLDLKYSMFSFGSILNPDAPSMKGSGSARCSTIEELRKYLAQEFVRGYEVTSHIDAAKFIEEGQRRGREVSADSNGGFIIRFPASMQSFSKKIGIPYDYSKLHLYVRTLTSEEKNGLEDIVHLL